MAARTWTSLRRRTRLMLILVNAERIAATSVATSGASARTCPGSALASTSTRSECWRPNEVDRQQHLAGDPGGDIVADTRSEDEERTRRELVDRLGGRD